MERLSVFPELYDKQVDQKTESKIRQIQAASDERISQMQQAAASKNKSADNGDDDNSRRNLPMGGADKPSGGGQDLMSMMSGKGAPASAPSTRATPPRGSSRPSSGSPYSSRGQGNRGQSEPKEPKTPTQKAAIAGLILGTGVGLLYLYASIDFDSLTSSANMGSFQISSIIPNLIIFAIIWVIGFLIPFALMAIFKKIKQQHLDNKEETLQEQIGEERRLCAEEISKIRESAAEEKRQYRETFESQVRQSSTGYARSDLTREVVEEFTRDIASKINRADRSSHIDFIDVTTNIAVYSDKIQSDTMTYDFTQKRARPLTDHLSQASIARAIEAGLRFSLSMEFMQDPSGGAVQIDITHYYSCDGQQQGTGRIARPTGRNDVNRTGAEDEQRRSAAPAQPSANISIKYHASNGNFSKTREW